MTREQAEQELLAAAETFLEGMVEAVKEVAPPPANCSHTTTGLCSDCAARLMRDLRECQNRADELNREVESACQEIVLAAGRIMTLKAMVERAFMEGVDDASLAGRDRKGWAASDTKRKLDELEGTC